MVLPRQAADADGRGHTASLPLVEGESRCRSQGTDLTDTRHGKPKAEASAGQALNYKGIEAFHQKNVVGLLVGQIENRPEFLDFIA